MRIARALACVVVAGLVGAACVTPPPPPPPLTLADLNGFFTGTSEWGGQGPPGCGFREDFYDISYDVPNRARGVELYITGCYEIVDSVDLFYTGTFVIDTSVGRLTGKVAGKASDDLQTHNLTLTVKTATGDWQTVRGQMRSPIQCDCLDQDPEVPTPVRGALAAQ